MYLSVCVIHLCFFHICHKSFLSTDHFISLGRFITRYGILFAEMVNEIVSLISLLVYKNLLIEFYILILYPTTLPNSLVNSSSFLVVFLGFFMSSADSDSFTSSFPIWIPFVVFFSCPIVVSKTSNTMLNKSGHPYLIPDLRGNVFRFSPLTVIAVDLSSVAFIMLRYAPFILTLWRNFIIYKL